MVNCPEVHHPFCNHLQYTANTGRMMLWPISVAAQAITRNSPVPVAFLCYTAAGPMTEMVFHEVASWVLACVTSGASIEVGGIALNTVMDHTTPYEPRFACEVAHAATGMSRREANAICRTLNDRYEKDLTQPPTGKNYRECFDVQTSLPSEEYRGFYENVKAQIRDLGIPLE
jgi:methylamine--corrinoid protein Co-methyltransferase